MHASHEIGRRAAIGMIGAAAALPVAPVSAAAGGGGGVDLSTPEARLRTYMLMRGALDERLIIACLQGSYFGVVDGVLTPLFGLVAATFARHRRRADGGYEVANGEIAFFTDLATGKFLESWVNPYTNETVMIPRQGLPPSTFVILPNMTFQLARLFSGKFEHHIEPAQVRGADIWIPELTVTSATFPGASKPSHYSEKTTLHARLTDFKPGAKQVGSDTSFTNIVSWRSWMNMGSRPGHMIAIGAGRYGASIATLPPALVDALGANQPELLANPASLIDHLWK